MPHYFYTVNQLPHSTKSNDMNLSITALKKGLFVAIVLLFSSQFSFAQIKYSAKDYVNIVISGTSTLHDWDMKSAKSDCEATFVINEDGLPKSLTSLSFSTNVDALKSGHGAMDKNAYKALKTDKYNNIVFKATSGVITAIDANNFTIVCKGKLTIAGTSVDTDLSAKGKLNADKSISVSGIKKISMKDYNVQPPTFGFGAIKTGNDISVKFDLTIKK
jgi:predicted regulator of Ras-like GTPase activity (Roadblock/LC7/MglB family)